MNEIQSICGGKVEILVKESKRGMCWNRDGVLIALMNAKVDRRYLEQTLSRKGRVD